MPTAAPAPTAPKLGFHVGPCQLPGCPLRYQQKVQCDACNAVVCRGCAVSFFTDDSAGVSSLHRVCKTCFAAKGTSAIL